MARYGITTTWQELTGEYATVDDLRARIAPFGLTSVLLGLARISCILKTFRNAPERARQQEIVRRTLPTYLHQINTLLAANPDRIVIARTSILFVAKQALLACPTDGPDAATLADVERVTTCCLIANDLLLAQPTGPDDPTITKAASMLTFSTYVPQDTFPTDLGRNLLLINQIAPQLAEQRDYRDLHAIFTGGMGMTPEQFCVLVFCAGTKFINYVDEQGLILDKTYFQHTALPQTEVDAFLATQTSTAAALQERALAHPGLDNNFLVFQERPLIEIAPDAYLCIDPGFLLEKAGKAFYWTLHHAVPRNQRTDLLGYWGRVIDNYIGWHALQTYRGPGQLIASPSFSNGAQVADLLLLEGSRLLLFEVKAVTLTAEAKYSFNAITLAADLQRKAIEGEPGERKGVAQLRHNITRLLEGDTVNGIELHDVTTIYPVLVFLDDSFVAPYLPQLYREAFDSRRLKRRGGPRLTTLHAITVDDLENVMPHTHRFPLADIFDDYYRNNRMENGTLASGRMSHLIPLLQKQPPGLDPVRDRFTQFGMEIAERAFPGQEINIDRARGTKQI